MTRLSNLITTCFVWLRTVRYFEFKIVLIKENPKKKERTTVVSYKVSFRTIGRGYDTLISASVLNRKYVVDDHKTQPRIPLRLYFWWMSTTLHKSLLFNSCSQWTLNYSLRKLSIYSLLSGSSSLIVYVYVSPYSFILYKVRCVSYHFLLPSVSGLVFLGTCRTFI